MSTMSRMSLVEKVAVITLWYNINKILFYLYYTIALFPIFSNLNDIRDIVDIHDILPS